MEKYKKYEFIENTNNKELYSLFKKPNYNEIEALKKETLDQRGFLVVSSIDLIFIMSFIGMILSFIVFKMVS